MRWAIFAGMLFLSLAGIAYSGIVPVGRWLGAGSYSDTIEAPTASVASALGDIPWAELIEFNDLGPHRVDVRGGRTAEGYTWSIVAAGKPMINMHVRLTPSEDGQSTYVSSWAEQASAFEAEQLPIGFRNVNGVGGLWATVVETELNEFAPPAERLPTRDLRRRQLQAFSRALTTDMMADPRAMMDEASRRMDEMAPGDPDAIRGGWEADDSTGARWEANERSDSGQRWNNKGREAGWGKQR